MSSGTTPTLRLKGNKGKSTNPNPNRSGSGQTQPSAAARKTPHYAKGTQASKKGTSETPPSSPTKPTQLTNNAAKSVAKASATAPKVGDRRGRDNISETPPRGVAKTNPRSNTNPKNYPIFAGNTTSTIGTNSTVSAGGKVVGSGKKKASNQSTKRLRQTLQATNNNLKDADNDSIMEESVLSSTQKQPATNTANLQKVQEDQILDPTGSDGPGDENTEEDVSSEKASSDGETGSTVVNKPRWSGSNVLSAAAQPKSPDRVNGTKEQDVESLLATDKSKNQGDATSPPKDSTGVKNPSVRFGNASQRNFDVNSTPSGNEVTPPSKRSQNKQKSGTSFTPQVDVAGEDDEGEDDDTMEDGLDYAVSELPTTGLDVPTRLQLGTIPSSTAVDGRFISVTIQLPTPDQLPSPLPGKWSDAVKKFVCEEIQRLLNAFHEQDSTAELLFVYSGRDSESSYYDPKTVLSWKVLSTVFCCVHNHWILYPKKPSLEDEILSGDGNKSGHKSQRKKAKKTKRRKSRGKSASNEDDDINADGTRSKPLSRSNLNLTMRLNTKRMAEEYVVGNSKEDLFNSNTRAYIKHCQELVTVSNYAIIMVHLSICATTLLSLLRESLVKQEEAMFKFQGKQSKYVRREVDATGKEVFVKQPLPHITLRYSTPQPIRSKGKPVQQLVTEKEIPMSKVYQIEMSTSAFQRLGPVLEQLRENHTFRRKIGQKVAIIRIGQLLPKSENLQDVMDYHRNIAFNRGMNACYDIAELNGCMSPYVSVKITMSDDASRQSQSRSTNLLNELTQFIVPWYDPRDRTQEVVPYLASQVAAVMNSKSPRYGSATVVFYGGSSRRQAAMANMSQFPLQWLYCFLRFEREYHPLMVTALLKRSFWDQHAVAALDEDEFDWNPETLTVSTQASMEYDKGVEENMAEGLHLSLDVLLASKHQVDLAEERAAHFSNQEGNPDASVAVRQDGDSDHLSRGTGISKGASTINSELTNSFNENRKMKYAATKLELSKGKAKIADQEAEIAELRRKLAALSNAQGDTDGSNNETDWQNISSNENDQMDIDVDVDGSSSEEDDSDSSASDDDSTTDEERQAKAHGDGQDDDSSEDDDSSASNSSSDSSSSSSSTAFDAKAKSSTAQFDVNEYDEAAAQRPRSSSKSTDGQSGDGEESSDA